MEKYLFSIIVPVYNVEKFLDTCISSVLNQSYTSFELILVDDGSTDQSGIICDRYAELDSRVKVIHQENGGVSCARNKGLDAASGEWICFVDSDDEVKPDWLEHYAQNADADLLVQGMQKIFSKGNILNLMMPDLYLEKDERLNLHVGKHCLYSPIKCFRADIIRSNKLYFMKDVHLAEDLMFVLDYMVLSKSVRFIPYEGYVYNHQNSTLTMNFYSPNMILIWNDKIQNAVLTTCKGKTSSILYKSIAEHQFSNLSQYVTFNYKRLSRHERYSLYAELRKLYKWTELRHLKWTRYVFILLPLHNIIFDWIIKICSFLYKS